MGGNKRKRSIAKTLFLSAMKKTCIYPTIVFLFFAIITAVNVSDGYMRNLWLWYDFCSYDMPFYLEQVLNVLLIAVALINAVRVFDFTLSKAKSNVIFSLGVRRSTVFLSNILGGIVPMVLAFAIPAVLELASGYFIPSHGTLHPDYIRLVLLFVLFNICTYSFAYTVFSTVTACSDNVITALIFSPVIFTLPTGILQFIHTLYKYCIPGVSEANIEFLFTNHNWGMPYLCKRFYTSVISNRYILRINTDEFPDSIEISGIIFCAVYAVIAVIIGTVAFSKRNAENIGMWGKAKVLTEICAVITGINLINLFPFFSINAQLNNAVLAFLIIFLSFAVAYLAVKLIFSKPQKKRVVHSLKRLCIYAVAFAGSFCMLVSNFFGLASPQISVDKIATIELRSPFFDYVEQYVYYDSFLGLQSQGLPHESKYAQITFLYDEDISTVLDIYNSLSDEISKINANESAMCEAEFTINLNNGRQIKKSFSIASDESIEALLRLNDLKLLKDSLAGKFDNPTETFGGGYSSFSDRLTEEPAYLFGTDMTFAKNIGTGDEKLLEALKKDIVDQSVREKFFHTADDELGIIVFGPPSEYSGFIDYDATDDNSSGLGNSFSSYYGDDYSGDGYDYKREEYIPPEEINGLDCSAWSIHRTNRYFVITKDMENTVNYLKSRGFDKYLKNTRDIQSIKSVKTATRDYLADEIALPIFSAAYWSADMIEDGHKELQTYDYNEYPFGEIDEVITDKKEIEKLMSDAVVFGFCAKDSRIMEITYDDGAIATVMVRADASQ